MLGRLLIALAAVCASSLLQATELKSVRLSSGPLGTRVVLDLSGPSDHRLFELANPERIVIDLPRTAETSSVRLPEPKGHVASIRTGPRPNGELRVVLDLAGSVSAKSFLLGPSDQFGHRLVVDLEPRAGAPAASRRTSAPLPAGRDLVVVVDAGHGGQDPGAIGRQGTREKDVTLAIARQLAAQLSEVRGIRGVLTRDGNHSVSFADRLGIAHRERADLFVSIHADAYGNENARGATVYALSTGRASDEVARRVVERENAADLIGGVSIADKDDMLAHVLLDLSQSAAISASLVVGKDVVDALGAVTRLRKTTVQQGSLLVLTSPDIPSILVETAYISNRREENALRDPAYQREVARAIRNGVVAYFRDHAPADTYVAQYPPPEPRNPVRHVIARGETLSGIAERYRISVRHLRESNALKGDVIRIGQVLMIPSS
jgi:N-acetylmuramoyl-L-alanine amidase